MLLIILAIALLLVATAGFGPAGGVRKPPREQRRRWLG